MTRAEHLQWCKERALEYLPADIANAWASMISDLRKHPETAGHIGIQLGMMEVMNGSVTPHQMRHLIEGFN